MNTAPAVGSMRRLRQRTRVDLPDPDKPMTMKISPSSMSKPASETATTLPVSRSISSFDAPPPSMSSAAPGESPNTFDKRSARTVTGTGRLSGAVDRGASGRVVRGAEGRPAAPPAEA